TVDALLETLSADNVDASTAIVRRYLDIRGYGPVKELAAAEVRKDIAERIAALHDVKDKAA
ncbi:MAG: hypothetical protein RLN69_16605, partial [Woeseiaceae bacterium]